MRKKAKKSAGPRLTGVSYDADTWTLQVTVNGTPYEYADMSPFHNDEFVKRARRNTGRAMSYLRTTGFPCTRVK